MELSKYRLPFLLSLLMIFVFLAGCSSSAISASDPCSKKQSSLCEDFEGLSGDLGGSQWLQSSLPGNWWVTEDKELEFLFQDFPVDRRSQSYMILLGDGSYGKNERSLLYTADIDLTNVETAVLSYNLIYRTEKHWDGLVVFAIKGGVPGIQDGANWIVLTPENGYPESVNIDGMVFPGYSGVTSIWLQEKIDLSPVLGGRVVLAFFFVSDSQFEDWGVALDDISIQAEPDLIAAPLGRAIELGDLDLKLQQDDFYAPKTPQVNVITDSNCEGSPDPLLATQRAYIKALNETGDRALVLHPTSSQFCWVKMDDVWVSGDTSGIVRISDSKPEDYYLPTCVESFPPQIEGSNCSQDINETDLQSGFYPYQVKSALVEDGFVNSVVLIPFSSPEEPVVDTPDPRTTSLDDIGEETLATAPGGAIWLRAGDFERTCYHSQSQPEKIICTGLRFNAGGPLQFELCWQGYGEEQACPPGLGEYSTGCLLADEKNNCSLACPLGYRFNTLDGLCVLNRDPDLIDDSPDRCPNGMAAFSEAGCCGPTKADFYTLCPAGYYYQIDQAVCLRLPTDGTCPEGYLPSDHTRTCQPTDPGSDPRCTSILVEFPLYELVVKQSTRCYMDPEERSEIVSSLDAFSIVTVLGMGEDRQTLVINNPDYQVPCWASVDDFYTDDLDLNILPIIIVD